MWFCRHVPLIGCHLSDAPVASPDFMENVTGLPVRERKP